MKQKININGRHIASLNGYLQLIQYLIERDANIEAKYKNHLTPLHYACPKGTLTKYLLNIIEETAISCESHDVTDQNLRKIKFILQGMLFYVFIMNISCC